MPRLLIVLALVFALVAPVGSQGWFTSGPLTNPATDAVAADTGPRDGPSTWQWQMVCSASVTVRVVFQHRNAANDASIREHHFFVGANAPPTVFHEQLAQNYDDQERLRVIVGTGVTGAVQCSLLI